MQLLIDGYVRKGAFLTDDLYLGQTLQDLVHQVGMKAISRPFIVKYPDGDGREWGLSAVVFLAESNITVHTYPESSFAFIDIFSCRDFSPEHILNWLRDRLGLHDYRSLVLARGIKDGEAIPLSVIDEQRQASSRV